MTWLKARTNWCLTVYTIIVGVGEGVFVCVCVPLCVWWWWWWGRVSCDHCRQQTRSTDSTDCKLYTLVTVNLPFCVDTGLLKTLGLAAVLTLHSRHDTRYVTVCALHVMPCILSFFEQEGGWGGREKGDGRVMLLSCSLMFRSQSAVKVDHVRTKRKIRKLRMDPVSSIPVSSTL